ncbi:MAG TPA: MMPL family transporter, partial [Chitinophagaceae bacterium]|nr:MMPL family transporter [Chitinophagaceae bacterium]
MWERIGRFVLRYRLLLLIALLAASGFMAREAGKVQLSYEFAKAIPLDNPKYQLYQSFKARFGEDGNLLVVGLQNEHFFNASFFNDYLQLVAAIKKIESVEDVLSVSTAVNLVKDSSTEKLNAVPVFGKAPMTQDVIDSSAAVFKSLPFYNGLLYNPYTHAYLTGIRINKNVLNSAGRTKVVQNITDACETFSKKQNTELHYSGLPLIRTTVADRIAAEMKWFLIGSLLLSAFILLLFFRSFSSMLLSLTVVILGVIWSVGVLVLLGYKITLLTALIPPLVVVIGIPNCIYFL